MKATNFILALSLLSGCKAGEKATSADLADTWEAYDSPLLSPNY